MTADQLFSILNLMAVAAWLPLVFLPRARWSATVVPVLVPVLLAVVYVVLVAIALPRSKGGFSSLAGVSALFDNPWLLVAGWTHYLAFDLFIGGWEARDAQSRGIPHLLIAPALVLTLLFGPAGLLLYLAIRRWAPSSAVQPPSMTESDVTSRLTETDDVSARYFDDSRSVAANSETAAQVLARVLRFEVVVIAAGYREEPLRAGIPVVQRPAQSIRDDRVRVAMEEEHGTVDAREPVTGGEAIRREVEQSPQNRRAGHHQSRVREAGLEDEAVGT